MSTSLSKPQLAESPSQHGRPNRAGEIFDLVSEFSDVFALECIQKRMRRLRSWQIGGDALATQAPYVPQEAKATTHWLLAHAIQYSLT
jgi:hypothetical protein